jgi:AraC-like DNA-binding protein
MSETALAEPLTCRLPEMLTLRHPQAEVALYDHRGENTPARSLVSFSRYALAVVVEGEKYLIDAPQMQRIEVGDLVLYRPGNVHSTSIPHDGRYRSLILFFTDAVVRSFMARHGVVAGQAPSTVAFRKLGRIAAARRVVEGVRADLDAGRYPSAPMIGLILEQLLLMALETEGPEAFSICNRGLAAPVGQRLSQVVDAHWQRNLGLDDLAFLCGMSLSTFKRAFRAHYGMAPGKWLQERRLKHASHLLVAERRRASEVFELVGYANHSVFSQSFKKHYGMSPREFQLSAIEP